MDSVRRLKERVQKNLGDAGLGDRFAWGWRGVRS